MSQQVERLGSESPKADAVTSPQASPDTPPQASPWSRDWNPFEEMQRMQNEMNKIFGDMRSQLHQTPDFNNFLKPFQFSPNVDIKEEDERFVVTADIPGSDAANIEVKLQDNHLSISANTTKSAKHNGGILRSERFIGKFERSITLPSPVVADKMKTDYKDGVLTVISPKQKWAIYFAKIYMFE